MQTDKPTLRLIAFKIGELNRAPTLMGLRMMEIESDFDNEAVSVTGCVGYCQINPKDALDPGFGIPPCHDPYDATMAATYLFNYLDVAEKHHGTWGRAALAYNVGMGGDFSTASQAYKNLAAYWDMPR